MRTLTLAERNLLAAYFGVYARLSVRDASGNWIDTSGLGGINWFESAEWDWDVDQPVMSGTISLRRSAQGYSLAPLLSSSQFNRDSQGQYAPLLYAGRGFRLETACTVATTAPLSTDWREVFLGKIDFVDWASSDSLIGLQVRDIGAHLLATQIEDPTVYSTAAGQPVEAVVQAILDDWMGAGAVTLYTPVSPNWIIRDYEQVTTNVMDAIRTLARQLGWDIRYKYDASHVFRLTLYDPRAPKTLRDTSFGPSEYIEVTNLNISDADIRNVVQVLWTAAA